MLAEFSILYHWDLLVKLSQPAEANKSLQAALFQ